MLAADLIQRLIDFLGADSGDRALGAARRAMQDAIRAFPGLHRWTYGYATGRLVLNAPYSTGTVAYNNSTRALTLTGGTWPSWAASGNVRINDVISKVSTRDSDTVLTLDATLNPGQTVAAGAAYSLYQDKYELPADFLASDAALAEVHFGEMVYIHPHQFTWFVRSAERTGVPCYYTFVAADTPGRFAMLVSPYPDSARTIDFVYQRRLRNVRYDIEEAGTVSVTSGQAAVTGVSTKFRSDMVGSYIRFSRDAVRPTGAEGVNPTPFESKITAVGGLTTLTLADNAPETFSGVAYVVSDPLDVDDTQTANALCWQAMKNLAASERMKDRAAVDAEATTHLLLAKEHDARSFALNQAGPGRLRRPTYQPTGPDEV